ncbi:MAG: nickel pincer cofactor biosynthesis protein LarC [Ruminococcus sp.]|nr:nickel pincer cofactor biosynthesis protein LarC [Ruminococcus sp.]
MGRKLYLECYSGISGDMAVAALLDLGADRNVLKRALDSLSVQGFQIEVTRVVKSGIDACDFHVILDAAHENRDHDMEYLHGHPEGQERIHDGDHVHRHDQGDTHAHIHHDDHAHDSVHDDPAHVHGHAHEHTHDHAHSHARPHEHRGMKEIREIIGRADMTEGARGLALKIFEILAQAESKAHRVPVDQVHFHEVGAVDSIVDIVAAAVCLDSLQITEAVIPALCEGQGTIRCQHGILPIPVPAVANIVQAYRLPLKIVDAEGEFVTPTGAAIAAAIRTEGKLPEEFSIEKIGIGAGKRKYERPGILRAMLISPKETERDVICKLETNIDDCSGEMLGRVMDKLFLAGARDVHYTPVYMKKNRPAWQLNVICKEEDRERLEQLIFRETTTIGIRRQLMDRTVLKRQQATVRTPFGEAKVKICQVDNRKRYYPEYESVLRLCEESGLPYPEAYQLILQHKEDFAYGPDDLPEK